MWYSSIVQNHCWDPARVLLLQFACQKNSQIVTGKLIGQECWKFAVKIVARNGMQSSSKNHTQNDSRKISQSQARTKAWIFKSK
jgi:hypothetical protein